MGGRSISEFGGFWIRVLGASSVGFCKIGDLVRVSWRYLRGRMGGHQ